MSNKPDIEDFFNSIALDDIEVKKGSDSLKEIDNLFNGDLSDINDWLLHEQFLIKKKNKESERALREKNAKKAFTLTIIWMIFIMLLILIHGFGRKFGFYKINQSEFLFVIGTLTFSIFTFYSLVLRYLFYRNNK